ncbi:hypothetical protein K443DRAFT_12869 [Laccaria amethystina LaAM-08-1]|uniref:Uncharacterized protein n=1 Tax=Laccaria amethystina LaAM-08-1 TaxID=1095629 RepID=A0A0C9X744_9AGAR|nr:hypothetical protein K443DRAFT_12869 [Laccaria amethystina LaAM-08-1]
MPPSPPPTMSARDQQAANQTTGLAVVPAKPNKHNETVVSDSDDAINDAAIAVEEANDGEQGGKKGKKEDFTLSHRFHLDSRWTPERTSANPDTRFGVTNNANLLLPTTTIHDNHPPPPPTTNTPTPPPSTTPTATTTATATVVVLHKPRHHQTADVARQWFIWVCHVDGDSQDAKRDPATPNFEDHATKERGKGATGGQGNKGPAAARYVVHTIDGNRAIDRVLSPPLSNPLTHLHRTTAQDHAHPFTRGPHDDDTALHQWELPRTLTAPPFMNVDHPHKIENAKGTPARLQPIERKLLAAGTSVTLPERPACSQVGSVLPPAPTVSSSCARVDREPKLTAVKVTTASDNEDTSHGSEHQADSGDHDTNSDSDSDHDIGGHIAKIISATVRIGPPSRAKATQPSEAVTAAADTSEPGILDVKMHSPPYVKSSRRGRARTWSI